MEVYGKVAVVTGAAAGIGRAVAKRLAKKGAFVVVADIDADWGREAAREIRGAGGQAVFADVDVSSQEGVQEMIGVAVSTERGLMVPVVRDADRMSFAEIEKAIAAYAVKAREGTISVDDLQGGTFTITNPGIFGALYGLPLINQPQVAILGVGAIEKRAIVVDDAIAIRRMCYVTLGYDHRLIDGADAGRFLSFVKDRLEHFEEGWM